MDPQMMPPSDAADMIVTGLWLHPGELGKLHRRLKRNRTKTSKVGAICRGVPVFGVYAEVTYGGMTGLCSLPQEQAWLRRAETVQVAPKAFSMCCPVLTLVACFSQPLRKERTGLLRRGGCGGDLPVSFYALAMRCAVLSQYGFQAALVPLKRNGSIERPMRHQVRVPRACSAM
eukprot:2008684-Rhodomonas_salina.1